MRVAPLVVVLALSTPALAQPVAVTHVNVVDVRAGKIVPDTTVVVSGDRITAVGRTAKVPVDARLVDGRGRYLIPGLWDMHVHWQDPRSLPMFVANGVTGVRYMFGAPYFLDWQKRTERGELLGPRSVVGSPIVDGENPVWPGSIVVRGAADAPEAVKKIREAGYAFVKVYELLTPDAYRAILAEAKRQGLPVAGHVPQAVSAAEASDLGQRSIEHSTGVLLAASSEEDVLRARARELWKGLSSQVAPDRQRRAETRVYRDRLLETFDAARAAALFRRFARNHTALVPTLTVERASSSLDDPKTTGDERVKYFAPEIGEAWRPGNDRFSKNTIAADWEQARRVYRKKLELVGVAHRAGVRILAGTDVLNPFCFPGFSLHDELGLLVEAGLSPLEALRAATLYPAEYLGREKTAGTIAVGRVADLVLLEANPLDDIAHTRRIAAVVAAGRLLDRVDLDRLFADALRIGRQRSIGNDLLTALEKDGLPAARKLYREARRRPEEFDLAETQLNLLGYHLLGQKKLEWAIAVFELNVEAYPASGNVYDSLGEAQLAAGKRDAALASYRRAFELDPKNDNAARKVRELEGKSP